MKKKQQKINIYHGCLVQTEKSVPRDHWPFSFYWVSCECYLLLRSVFCHLTGNSDFTLKSLYW